MKFTRFVLLLLVSLGFGAAVLAGHRKQTIPLNGLSWTNSGAAISTPVTVTSGSGSWVDYAATNTSSSTTYYIEFFNATSGSVTLGTTAPIWIMVVPPGPSGAVEHFTNPHAIATALSVAFVTAPGGSTPAPGSTCWASAYVRN